ncbi:hypothetical protein KTO58_17865 [Chitinophaga pendula]|uniref:hypothetical protein n=1 Tax=Chitinophaga TaxID=79328 RepID=UPI000BAE800D|nr:MULTISPECIES: hypothetical protein [Chitinophaga]ASZ11440.1 hypothetical protein CK934_10970 [Chitinophaga sp. MD30]UCJ05553.1 hypothetical protein KTO58_17865 [Chitinophaga pendula]
MQRDYMLEIVEEIGRLLRAIILLKKSHPAKAMEEIQVAFNATRWKDKAAFDQLDLEGVKDHLAHNDISPATLDLIIDLLLEEIDIKTTTPDTNNIDVLLAKTDWLIIATEEKERRLKQHSLKRNLQRKRLQELITRIR